MGPTPVTGVLEEDTPCGRGGRHQKAASKGQGPPAPPQVGREAWGAPSCSFGAPTLPTPCPHPALTLPSGSRPPGWEVVGFRGRTDHPLCPSPRRLSSPSRSPGLLWTWHCGPATRPLLVAKLPEPHSAPHTQEGPCTHTQQHSHRHTHTGSCTYEYTHMTTCTHNYP